MNILIEADAFKVTGNELANLDKAEITKFVTVNVGRAILPELIITENIQDINNEKEINTGSEDDLII